MSELFNDAHVQEDAAFPIVSAIARVVPASTWTFASISHNGTLGVTFGSGSDEDSSDVLAAEYRRLRLETPAGPKLAPIRSSIKPYAAGATLLFADARLNYGILTLLRTAELGPFTSPELSMLGFALDAVSEHLSSLRLQPPALGSIAVSPNAEVYLPLEGEGAFYVLDDELRIVLAWTSSESASVPGLESRTGERLPAIVEQTVRELTAAWPSELVRRPGIARPVAFLVIRTQPMSGAAGAFTGVRIDRYQQPNSLTAMAARFQISPRETQVLARLLEGDRLEQIAKKLFITSSTVQDHVKSMLDKTNSRNRSELIARILGWQIREESTLGYRSQ